MEVVDPEHSQLPPFLAQGWDGARGGKWKTNGHPAFYWTMALEFLLDILSFCFLLQYQFLTQDP